MKATLAGRDTRSFIKLVVDARTTACSASTSSGPMPAK